MIHRLIGLHLLRWGTLFMTLALVLGTIAAPLPTASAQEEALYFPETGQYLRGAFRFFWESNGALSIFGYPITGEYVDSSSGRVTQYFERARFELIENNGQYSVALGRLGVEYTQGRAFPQAQPIQNTADRRYIPETGYIIQYGFKEIWETRGGERIFGYPISNEVDEQFPDGAVRTVQYFERARFEYWPNRAAGDRVLFTNLGRLLAPPELTLPAPAPPQGAPPAEPEGGQPGGQPAQPETAPPPPVPIGPQDRNARAIPSEGPPGTTFRLEAFGFRPGEEVGIWVTAPDLRTFGAGFQVEANENGNINDKGVGLPTDEDFLEGIWSFHARGIESGNEAVAYFRVGTGGPPAPAPAPAPEPAPAPAPEPAPAPAPAVPAPAPSGDVPPPGDPNKLGVVIHDQIPAPQGNAFILPIAGPADASFGFSASGYAANEVVQGTLAYPDGESIPVVRVDGSNIQADQDGVVRGSLTNAALQKPLQAGDHRLSAVGTGSGISNAASFRVTNDFIAGPGTPRPANINGSATPAEGGGDTIFEIRGEGLQPNEELEFWVTEPSGIYTLIPFAVNAQPDGRVGYDPVLDIAGGSDLVPGVYGVHFRGKSSGARVAVYFTYTGPTAASLHANLDQPLYERMAGNAGIVPAAHAWAGSQPR